MTIALFITMATYCSPLNPSVPALQFTYSEAAFKAITETWGEAGVDRFKGHFLIDFPFLLCYGLLGYWIVTRTEIFSRLPQPIRTALAWCLPLAALADAVENVLHWHLLSSPGPFGASLYFTTGAVATIKWGLDALFVICVVWALSTRFLKR